MASTRLPKFGNGLAWGLLCGLMLGPSWVSAQVDPRTIVSLAKTFPGTTTTLSGTTLSTLVDPADARNTATARIDPGGAVGLGVTVGTANAGGVYQSRAIANWGDAWSSPSGGGLNVNGFHAAGEFSPEIGNDLRRMSGTALSFQGFFELNFLYSLTDNTTGYSDVAFISMNLDGVVNVQGFVRSGSSTFDLASRVIWGTSPTGAVTFDFTVGNLAPPGGLNGSSMCGGGCSESLQSRLILSIDGSPGFASPVQAADFLNTFSVELRASDPDAVWTSTGGRALTPVPEPGRQALLALGVGALWWRRRRVLKR